MSAEWEPTAKQRMFVAALAKMVAPMQSAEAVNAMMAMLPAFKHLPLQMFDQPGELAVAIGADMDRVPTLARLRKALDAFHEARRPKSQMPALPDATPNMSKADRVLIDVWHRIQAGTYRLEAGVSKERWLSMVRQRCTPAYRYLIRTDNAAAEIAVVAGWERDHGANDEAARQAVSEMTATLYAGRFTTDASNAPSTVPPEAAPGLRSEAAAQFEAAHGRPPGALAPEVLAAVRERAGIKLPPKPPPPANDPTPPPPPSPGPFPWSQGTTP